HTMSPRDWSSDVCSSDLKVIATGSSDKTVQLWDIKRAQEIATLAGHTEPVHCVCFSPDGRVLASADEGTEIRLWDCATRKQLREIGRASCRGRGVGGVGE